MVKAILMPQIIPRNTKNRPIKRWKYCSTTHELGKDCKKCGCSNHFERQFQGNIRPAPRGRQGQRIRTVHEMCQNSDTAGTLKKNSKVIRSNFIDFHNVICLIVTNLKSSHSKKLTTCEYKIDTGSNDNLIPTEMFRMLFVKHDHCRFIYMHR